MERSNLCIYSVIIIFGRASLPFILHALSGVMNNDFDRIDARFTLSFLRGSEIRKGLFSFPVLCSRFMAPNMVADALSACTLPTV